MKINTIKNILILSIFLLISCREEYYPDLDNYENALVVEGMITAEPGPYLIKLSMSSLITKVEFTPFSNAEVKIFDNLGNNETLTETSAGEYYTSDNGFQSVVGRKYKIQIITPDDKMYSSDFEELLAPVGIDSLYAKVETKESIFHDYDLQGLQFYIDSELVSQDTTFLMYRLESTYKFNSSFIIVYSFDGVRKPVYNTDTLFTCWKTENLQEIYLSNTIDLTEARIFNFPINYVSTEDRSLSIKYSLLVKQMCISKKAYDYWYSVDELNAEQGTFYSSLPYQIRGNIFNENDENELVLGYFMATGISEKRIFIERPILDFHYIQCIITPNLYEAWGMVHWLPPSFWPLFATIDFSNGRIALPHQNCVNCTKKGGYLNKPEFWID